MRRMLYYKEYVDLAFAGTKKPSPNTVKKWVRNGQLDGRFIGSMCYVFVDDEIKIAPTGNKLVNETLKEFGYLK
ncbi:MAG: hypothetical protein OEZ68_02430 [Gammaproteobacteria bacterium]|nr:hypothetical protein [Gammaproteobacteria bacterium]MDH5799639.1 hypothetical protein [Gammaproteobacteria bacterium]